jgi:serine/threonine-protein kinase
VKTRLQHIGEARIALENYKEPVPVGVARPANWLVTAVVAVLAAAGAGFVCWRMTRPEPAPFVRLSVNLGRDALTQSVTRNTTFDLSADGRKVAYVARGPAGVPQLAIRYFDREQPLLLPGTEDAISPFFSPDGEWVVYAAAGKLKKVMSGGGLPIPLADAPNPRGGTFDAAGDIIVAPNIRGGLMLIPVAGGAPRPYTNLTGAEVTHRWPHALPGGAGVVFISSATPGNYENAVIEFASPKGERKVLHRGGYMPRYLASGHLTFMSQGNLFAAPLDLQKMELTGPPVAVLHDVDAESGGGLAPLAASANGMFLYRSGMGQRISDLVWVDAAGRQERLPLKPMEIRSFHLSPDGKRVAIGGRSGDVSVYNIATDVLTRLQSIGGDPLWTPDGRHLACTNIRGITLLPSDGSGISMPLTDNPIDAPSGWGPDASVLYFSRANELWRLPLDWTGGGPPKPGRPSRVEGAAATRTRISPDGRFGAGSSTVSGNYEVNVFSLADGQKSRWQVSTEGGFAPTWSPRGNELFYVRGDGRVVSVPYRTDGESFQPGKAQLWEEGKGTESRLGIEVSPDGKRYLSLAVPEGQKDAPQAETILLLGFFDELKRRVGGK